MFEKRAISRSLRWKFRVSYLLKLLIHSLILFVFMVRAAAGSDHQNILAKNPHRHHAGEFQACLKHGRDDRVDVTIAFASMHQEPELRADAMMPTDFAQKSSDLFGSYRIPAMLIASAAYGGLFAMPLSPEEGITFQLGKRSYMLIGLGTVIAEVICTVIATMAIDKLTVQEVTKRQPARTLASFLALNLETEWIAVRVNFLLGLIGFVVMCGMRFWVSQDWPVFGKTGLVLIATSVMIMLGIINESLREDRNLPYLLAAYVQNLWSKAREGKKMFVGATFCGVCAVIYIPWAYIYTWLHFVRTQ